MLLIAALSVTSPGLSPSFYELSPLASPELPIETRIESPRLMEVSKSPPALPPKEIPLMLARIAYCESRNRHHDIEGNVLRGVNPHDIGKYQINITHWGDRAQKWGYDIFTEEGNEGMALALYERYGASPWIWSKKCWTKNI